MKELKIKKGEFAAFLPTESSNELFFLEFGKGGNGRLACYGAQANVIIAKHNERVSKAETDCALRKALERLLSQASECEGNRKKAQKANEKPKDDKTIKETTNRSVRHLKSTKKGKSVLDEWERKYLEAVLAPFKNRVTSIAKKRIGCCPDSEYIKIEVGDSGDSIVMPYFGKGTMYKGMNVNREYTAEELGLWK